MTEDQEHLLKRAINRDLSALLAPNDLTGRRIAEELGALAAVVLELNEKADRPLMAVSPELLEPADVVYGPGEITRFKHATCRGSYVLGTACGHCERCEEERNRLGNAVKKNRRPLRLRITEAVEDLMGGACSAEMIVDTVLECLDQDPGHDVTACCVTPTKDRTLALTIYRDIIQAIRRGE